MNCACCKCMPLVERVGHLLDHALTIRINELEHLVQVAHESHVRDMEDPPQRFPITSQALRMFWMFRRNLESVEVRTEVDE